MRILLTGCAGFIGFHTAKALEALGHAVTGVDNVNDYYDQSLKQARLSALGPGFDARKIDIAEPEAVQTLFDEVQPDVVVHLAAQAGVRHSLKQPFAYAHSNLLGHLSILEGCRHTPSVGHLVYASSSSVYGDTSTAPFREDDVSDKPVSLYAATKRADELMSHSYAKLYGLKQIGLRLFTVYGRWGRPDMAYWIFTEKVFKGEPIHLFNRGQMRRDMTHVDDVVRGICATVEAPPRFKAGQSPHRIYNVGNNKPVELLRLVDLIESACGRPAQRVLEGMPPGDVLETYADIGRFQADYDYAPATPIEDGVADFVDWYRERYVRSEVSLEG